MLNASKIKTTARAALAAAVIGSAGVAAMPAQAANDVQFGFSFNTGSGLSFSISGDRDRFDRDRRPEFRRVCYTNPQIRRELRRNGFDNISFGRERRDDVVVTANRGDWRYTFRIDRCDGRVAVLDRDRLRPQRPNWRHSDQNSLSFQFNFR